MMKTLTPLSAVTATRKDSAEGWKLGSMCELNTRNVKHSSYGKNVSFFV